MFQVICRDKVIMLYEHYLFVGELQGLLLMNCVKGNIGGMDETPLVGVTGSEPWKDILKPKQEGF